MHIINSLSIGSFPLGCDCFRAHAELDDGSRTAVSILFCKPFNVCASNRNNYGKRYCLFSPKQTLSKAGYPLSFITLIQLNVKCWWQLLVQWFPFMPEQPMVLCFLVQSFDATMFPIATCNIGSCSSMPSVVCVKRQQIAAIALRSRPSSQSGTVIVRLHTAAPQAIDNVDAAEADCEASQTSTKQREGEKNDTNNSV